MEDADKVFLANIKAYIRRKNMKRLIWRLLKILGIDWHRVRPGRWTYP